MPLDRWDQRAELGNAILQGGVGIKFVQNWIQGAVGEIKPLVNFGLLPWDDSSEASFFDLLGYVADDGIRLIEIVQLLLQHWGFAERGQFQQLWIVVVGVLVEELEGVVHSQMTI